jgi:hypothetical protein
MLLYQRLIRVQGSARAATTRNIANSETSAASRCGLGDDWFL